MVRGKTVSVYLNAKALTSLEDEIIRRRKHDGKTLITPKGLTVPRMVVACAYYVIDNGKIDSIIPKRPRRPDTTDADRQGKSVSVYLGLGELIFLESKIISRGKRKGKTLLVPKDLTVSRMVATCVDYVIDNGELESVIPRRPRPPTHTGVCWRSS
jgi:hypothetical protein